MISFLRHFALRGANPGSHGPNDIFAETKLLGLEVTVIKPSITEVVARQSRCRFALAWAGITPPMAR